MRVDVVMPQMGESIAEGTITRWLKQAGDTVERDEPIFEISTDKVDAEIPSPASGVLVEIKGNEGDTIPVNDVVAYIETDAAAAAEAPASAPAEAPAPAAEPAPAPAAAPAAPAPAAPAPPAAAAAAAAGAPAPDPGLFISPVVRRIAAEHGIDPSRVPGTGAGGRVTKKDIQTFIAGGGASSAAAAPAAAAATMPAAPASAPTMPAFGPGDRETREPMSQMRKVIAEHMIASRRTSAHVHSVFEIDVTHVSKLRKKYKAEYRDRHGANLTYMPFIVKAVCDGLRAWPILNASVDGDEIVYKKDLNIGIAVALEWGLIVPVLRNADELSIAGMSKRILDLGLRARNKQLSPDEVQGGTFTITNPGQFGGLFGIPIINQPQVGILGVGGIEKRPVVIDDMIAIRERVYFCMSYDHRVVDGAVADQALAVIKHSLENFDEGLL